MHPFYCWKFWQLCPLCYTTVSTEWKIPDSLNVDIITVDMWSLPSDLTTMPLSHDPVLTPLETRILRWQLLYPGYWERFGNYCLLGCFRILRFWPDGRNPTATISIWRSLCPGHFLEVRQLCLIRPHSDTPVLTGWEKWNNVNINTTIVVPKILRDVLTIISMLNWHWDLTVFNPIWDR